VTFSTELADAVAAPAAVPSFPLPAGVLGLVLVSVSLHSTAASPLKCITIPAKKNSI
jgi:hypothetical protein